MPFVDSQHLFSTLDFFTLDSRHFYSRLSTFLLSTLDFLVSTLIFYSRLSTFTLDSRQLLSTLDIYSRPSTFRYTRQALVKSYKYNRNFVGLLKCLREIPNNNDITFGWIVCRSRSESYKIV